MEAEKLVWNINEKDIYIKATNIKVSINFYHTELKKIITVTSLSLCDEERRTGISTGYLQAGKYSGRPQKIGILDGG